MPELRNALIVMNRNDFHSTLNHRRDHDVPRFVHCGSFKGVDDFVLRRSEHGARLVAVRDNAAQG